MAVYLRAYTPELGTIRNVAEKFQFPGGEVDLKHVHPFYSGMDVTWVADVRGAALDDLMAALLLADHAFERDDKFVLMLPYLPAARADKGSPLGARAYADMLNYRRGTFGKQVITIDPHSEAGAGHYNSLTVLDSLPLLDRALESQGHWRYDGIISPDKGAIDRASRVAQHYGLDLYVGDKKRDQATGKILSYDLSIPKLGKYLVVDDICDGGWTFTELARASGVYQPQLDLWVTHGIFSGNAHHLKRYYRRILTTDSHPGHNRVGVATTIVPTFTYMHEAMVKGL
ncbi:ribose-phosphate pyrophosphokinase [Mycobacterium phage Krypton555]|uniref:ribose-phosphate diphosphokinase n=1 Tax=Mycobacterium phage Krypton555 TaxID=2015885 RepID=A0A222ZSL1_9CAUD|nr:ribose-phosphate pyrophosphokinase [Mycobacterium phage Krypton555]ASR87111.1 phosphoribosyl pyrophosphate transferase [Mycobacterium phage Krypton555]